MHLYGRIRSVYYRSCLCRPRILQGQYVIAVWTKFIHKGKRRKTRLIVLTDTCLDAVTILRHYALRWQIEPGFNQTKNLFGIRQLWQRERQVLYLWLNMRLLAYGLLEFLIIRAGNTARGLVNQLWQPGDTITAGMLRTGTRELISQFKIRAAAPAILSGKMPQAAGKRPQNLALSPYSIHYDFFLLESGESG